MLGRTDIDDARLRIGFVVYGAMNRVDWRTVSEADVGFDALPEAEIALSSVAVRDSPGFARCVTQNSRFSSAFSSTATLFRTS